MTEDRPLGRVGRLRATAAERLWPIATLLVALSVAATVTSAPGRYVGDNRFDQFAAPGRRLARTLTLWDGSRGLGRVREDLWLGLTAPMAFLRALGLSVWLTERLFHALLIALGGLGMVALLRVFRPRIGGGHLLAGLIYSFGPYSAAFLQPTNLYAAYAAAPWLGLAALRGVTSTRPWHWAASFALVVFLLGNADLPGVTFAALVVLPALVWAVAERTATIRQAVGWLARAGVLTLGVSLAALYKTATGAATLSYRLETTESPQIVNAASSWTESLRGLGFWLTYFRGGADLARPQSEVYFSSPLVILATLALPMAAFGALVSSRVRGRVFFGTGLVLGTVVMVGVFPLDDPSPYGSLLLNLFDSLPSLAAFRTSFKAGALLMIGTAGLIGLGYPAFQRWAGATRLSRAVPAVMAAAVVLAVSLPFWTADLYDRAKSYETLPAYWPEALEYVDSLPGDGRVLVLPGTTRTEYRWGWVGDDIVDALLARNSAVDTAIPLSEPLTANLLHAVSDSVAEGTYEAGTLAPMLRRLGIDRVVIRNDIDWQTTRILRPARLDGVRRDPDLNLLRTFGEAGENTVADDDFTDDGRRERLLQPIEVYELVDPGPIGPRAVAEATGTVLVSGDGDAWPGLARSGDLTGTGPVQYTGSIDDADMADAVADAEQVVITDSNRRRVVAVTGFVLDPGPTLSVGQDQDRKADDPFERPGSQSVAWYADASRISTNGASRGLRGANPSVRPAAAFDGNGGSAWYTFEGAGHEGLRVRVDFAEPTEIRDVELTTAPSGPDAPVITEAQLRFSDGSTVDVPITDRSGSVDFEPRSVRWVEVVIADITPGVPAGVGFSEISFSGLDLREWISLPDDLVRRAAADPAVAAELSRKPVAYQFQRARSSAVGTVEPRLLRRFRVADERSFELQATLRTIASDTLGAARLLGEGCSDSTVSLDGEPLSVRLVGSPADLRPGDPIPVEGCEPVELDAGWHQLVVEEAPVASVQLRSEPPGSSDAGADDGTGTGPADPVDPVVRLVSASPGHFTLEVDAPAGGRLLSSQSFEERWVATVDGRSLGSARPYDTLAGWDLPAGRSLRVTLDYGPQRNFPATMFISGGFVVLCLTLALRRHRAALRSR